MMQTHRFNEDHWNECGRRQLTIQKPWGAPVAKFRRWMTTNRIAVLLLATTLVLTGCYTCTQAPGAVGKVIDAETGAPVRGAQITRPPILGGPGGRMGVPSGGLPAATVTTDPSGRFNLPPAVHTQIAFMYLPNPASISGSFVVSANGYVTNEMQGTATPRSLWRADLGRILLRKP